MKFSLESDFPLPRMGLSRAVDFESSNKKHLSLIKKHENPNAISTLNDIIIRSPHVLVEGNQKKYNEKTTESTKQSWTV